MTDTIGSRIRFLREQSDLTQAELADTIGVTASAIGLYENDKREPSLKVLNKFADYFNSSADYLLGRDAEFKSGSMSLESAIRSTATYNGVKVSDADKEAIIELAKDYLDSKDNKDRLASQNIARVRQLGDTKLLTIQQSIVADAEEYTIYKGQDGTIVFVPESSNPFSNPNWVEEFTNCKQDEAFRGLTIDDDDE